MWIRKFLVPSILLVLGFSAQTSLAQDLNQNSASNPGTRKVVRQTMPRYPELARRLNLAGTVKVVALVAPDGKVKKVDAVGGSPILVQAAEEAIYQWKFAAGAAESREVLELHFSPPQ